MFLTGKRTAATSPQKSLAAALAKPSTKPALVTYALSAIALAFLHAMQSDDKARLTIFVKSRKHPQYLNGRFLFILITQLLGAATYLFRNVLRDRFAFKWVGMSSGAPSVVLQVMVAFFVSTVSITATIPLACTAFALIRVFILPTLYQLPFVRIALRPVTAHFLRGPYTLSLPFRHIQLLARSWFVGLTTLFLWEATESMFDGMLSEPVHVAAPNPTILVSGTSSEDPIMKYFAYAELSKVTATSLAQRQTLFGDQNNVPNVWGAFVREALLLLGKDYQRLVGRDAEYTPEQTKPAVPSTPMAKPIPGTPTPLLRQSILRSQAGTRESVLDSIASDGPLAKAVEQTTEAAHIPELFRSVGSAASPLKQAPVVTKVKEIVANVEKAAGPGFVQRVKTAIRKRVDDSFDQHAPARVKEEVEKFGKWWTEDRLSRTVDACLPMRELDVVVMEGVCQYLCTTH
jgi:nucleoporin NDC1